MTTRSQLKSFLDRQRVLLQAERAAEVDKSSLLLSACSPKLLETKGLSLGGLGVVGVNIGLGGKSLVELERPSAYHTSQLFPPHTFRPGDLARIEDQTSATAAAKKKASSKASKDTPESNTVEGVVYKVSDSRIIIAVPNSDTSEDLDLPERCRLLKLANSITFDRMDRAIDAIERTVVPDSTLPDQGKSERGSRTNLNPLIEVLLGMKTLTPNIPIENLAYLDSTLNNSQKEAVRFALEAAEVACIHGPPGTGKTHTLVEIIRQLIAQGKRVLVCGASNLAVDNLLERLIPHNIPITRLGHPARVLSSLHASTLDAQAARSDESALAQDVKVELEAAMSSLAGKGKGRLKGAERKKVWEDVKVLRKEYRKREGQIVKRVMNQARIVLATCHSSGGRQLQNTFFDVVVIDEATQALEAVCWIPILKAKKLILAGDPLQLPPTIISLDKKSKSTEKGKEKVASGKGNTDKVKKSVMVPQLPKTEVPDNEDSPTSDLDSGAELNDDNPTTPSISTIVAKPRTKSEKQLGLKPPRSLETTLFERLERMYGPGIKRMLSVQYRMHAQIASFPSTTLYDSALISHTSVASHLLRDLPGASQDPDMSDVLDVPVVFFDTSGCEFYERLDGESVSASVKGLGDEGGSLCNENEVRVVKHWIEKLVAAGILPSQIAIISPYQAQVSLLSATLRTSMLELEIGTVDGMQGREKEAVVLSLVRSNDKREVGFLKEKRRLNVAMTRPRRHLCVIGDSSTVSQGSPYLKNWMEWLETNADVRYGEVD